MNWSECKKVFHADGSLRDIYVLNTNLNDWERLFDAFSQFETTLYCDGEPTPMIEFPAAIFERRNEHNHFLKVLVNGVSLHCHFFTVDEIVIDVDPMEIKSQRELDAVLDVMGAIGGALSKPVILTEEATHDFVWITFEPKIDTFTLHKH